MVRNFDNLDRAACYFCGGGSFHRGLERKQIRTNDGEVITDYVCAECDPRR